MEEATSTDSLSSTRGPIIVTMKGHSCSGKTTLAREIVRSLRLHGCQCSLLSYDDIRASIWKYAGLSSTERGLCDDVAYRSLCQVASTQLSLTMTDVWRTQAIVLDSSLSTRDQLEQVLMLQNIFKRFHWLETLVLVVECRPRDEVMWQQWSESRAAAIGEPSPWADIQREISEHKDYRTDDTLCLTVDTTDSIKSTHDHAEDVIKWMLYYQSLREQGLEWTIREPGSSGQPSRKHFTHDHSLFYYPQHDISPNDEKATGICALCREAPSGPVYGCSQCGYYLHKSCAELPQKIKFGGREFVLGPTREEEIVQSGECLVCCGQSGVLYSFAIKAYTHDGFKSKIHPKCAQLPHKLKHSCHDHPLEMRIALLVFACGACGTYGNYAGYYCKVCDSYFHVMCTLYLEASVIHERHWHPLVLCTIPRDDTDEYYCEICATERHPDLWAYYCKPCEYEAHISCVNLQIKPCNPEVLLPENRADGLSGFQGWRGAGEDVCNPILSEISGSQISWKPVDDEDDAKEPSSDSDTK